MKNLSLVMITKNEEEKLRRCLDSVKNIVGEIIIVDTGSTDKTKNIALEYNSKVFDYQWDDNFSNARNYGIDKSNGDWNLILDCDESITKFDHAEISNFINSNNNVIGKIKIVNLVEQDGEIRKSNSYISRLAPKKTYFYGRIHEQLDNSLPRTIVGIEVEHDGYLNTNKFERNISLILSELKENPKDTYLLYQAAKTYYVNCMFEKASLYFDKFYNTCDLNKDNFANDGIILYMYNIIKMCEFEKGLRIIDEVFDRMNTFCDFYFVCGVFFTELVAFDPNKYMCYFNNIELCYLNALQLGESNSYDSVEGTGSFLAAYNLGVFYELTGDISKAIEYYYISLNSDYKPALTRLNFLNR